MKTRRVHTDEHIDVIPLTLNDILSLSKLDRSEYWQFICSHLKTNNIVDALLGIFTLRQLSFGPAIELTGPNAIKYYLSNVISAIRNIPSAHTTIDAGGYMLKLSHPRNTLDPITACIQSITFANQTIVFDELSQAECVSIVEKLPPRVVQHVVDFIDKYDQPVVLIPGNTKLGIKQFEVSIFDSSIEQVAYMLFHGMSTNDILEIVFRLSKHITDTQFILSRTPQEIEFLQRLASEERQPK